MMDADDDRMQECQNSGSLFFFSQTFPIFVDSIRPFGLGT
jgi:hypothetical protein